MSSVTVHIAPNKEMCVGITRPLCTDKCYPPIFFI